MCLSLQGVDAVLSGVACAGALVIWQGVDTGARGAARSDEIGDNDSGPALAQRCLRKLCVRAQSRLRGTTVYFEKALPGWL